MGFGLSPVVLVLDAVIYKQAMFVCLRAPYVSFFFQFSRIAFIFNALLKYDDFLHDIPDESAAKGLGFL